MQFAVRRNYYRLLSHVSSNTGIQDDVEVERIGNRGGHCFEYLRNGLICNADLTLEPYIPQERSAKIWDLDHRCVNFEDVSKWATLVRSSDREGIDIAGG